MNLFRDALNLWARRDSQTASHNPGPELESEFEMPRRNGASAPTTPANSNSNMLSTSNSNPNTHSPLSSSPLSPADSTTSFTTAAAVSPDHIPAGGAALVRSGRGEAGGEGDEDTRDGDGGDGGDGGDLPSADVAFSDMASQYHKAKSLPPELKEHCRVYLEEALRMLPCLFT
ncbi:hypothetical protein SAMD00023353_3600070 [Rosellinia necatrix]|uniref:Uncharacterized protein n=1 Tax=Rosellinia necatrix TaxID=77044 RepID=A0A1S8A9E7_ROSNE|nr:hypothetical protein SAMD00023353_3600070 [Rosellinia necatrix]